MLPIYLPIRSGEEITGLYGLLSQTPEGQAPDGADDARTVLIEAIIEQSEDEALMAESGAARYLRRQGYQIIDRNHKISGVEVDIIAADRRLRTVILVEVKSRRQPLDDESPAAAFMLPPQGEGGPR